MAEAPTKAAISEVHALLVRRWDARRSAALMLGVGAVLALAGLATHASDGVLVTVHARHDPGTVFWRDLALEPRIDDSTAFRQRIINHYRSPPLPFPERVPPYRVRFDMTLEVRQSGDYGFELDAPGWFGFVDVAQHRVFGSGPFRPGSGVAGTVRLDAGEQPLTLVLQPRASAEGPIGLLWQRPGAGLRRLGADSLVPRSETPFALWRRGSFNGLVAAGVLLWISAGVLWSMSTLGGSSRYGRVLVVAALALLALATRAAHYDTAPRQNADEFHNAWVGLNLFQTGKPSSWSWLPGQDKEFIQWFDYGYPYVDYAFDHPPALPLLVGGAAIAQGARSIFDCVLPVIRLPMLGLAVLSVLMVFLLGSRLLGSRAGFWSATLMAVSPLSVFNSRLVKEDNLVQFWVLVALLAFVVAGESRRGQVASGISAGMAVLSKMMGIAVVFALAALVVIDSPRAWSKMGRILVPAAITAALYPLYGFVIDWEAFSATFEHLALAYPDESFAEKSLIVGRLLLEPKVNNNVPLFDGWILFGWLSLYLLKDRLQLLLPFVLYVLILLVTVRADSLWGFYSIPLYPFLFLAAGRHIDRLFDKQELFSVFAFISFCVVPTVLMSDSLSLSMFSFRTLMAGIYLPLVPAAAGPARWPRLWKANRLVLASFLIAALYASVETCLTTV